VTRWAILGTGGVATVFADCVSGLDGHELAAVGSRGRQNAETFAARWGGTPYGSYPGAVEDASVDAVYVATPTSHHYRHTLLALEAGKPVLCEKPLAVNAAQVVAMQSAAKARGLLLVEAMWSRFLPSWGEVRRLVGAGAIGDLCGVEATFGGRATYNPNVRAFRRGLAGGALLDTVVYPITFAQMILGEPSGVTAVARFTESGVDAHAAVLMAFPHGSYAHAAGGILSAFPGEARVLGTEGMIHLPSMTNPPWLGLYAGEASEVIDFPADRHRFAYQIEAFGRALDAGFEDSGTMSHADSLTVASILDAARHAVGLEFDPEVEAIA
jgi:predicted dehydrogenase